MLIKLPVPPVVSKTYSRSITRFDRLLFVWLFDSTYVRYLLMCSCYRRQRHERLTGSIVILPEIGENQGICKARRAAKHKRNNGAIR